MLQPLMSFFAGRDVTLSPAPITPSWIESGSPEAKAAALGSSDDGSVNAVLWTCTPGRFTWHYAVDESIYFLAGSVRITAAGEPERRFGAGDFVHFSRGAVATWVVESEIRKLAYCRRAPPRRVSLMIREARALAKRLIRGRSAQVGSPALLGG